MFKYANVTFPNGNIKYCYWTNILDLEKGDTVLVETIYGLKIAKFTGYATSEEQEKKANKWIYLVFDKDRIVNNLKIELEEEGISFSNPRKQRFEKAKKMAAEYVQERLLRKRYKTDYFWDDSNKQW
jgi:hypothetical protein